MVPLKELEDNIRKLNNEIDGITDKLVSALEKYQARYELLLLNENFDLDNGQLKNTLFNYNKAQAIDPYKTLGFSKIAISHINEYEQVANDTINFNKRIGINTDLNFNDVTTVKELQQIDLANMYNEAKSVDVLIKKELVNAIALNADYKITVHNLAAGLLGKSKKQGNLVRLADSYLRTSMFGLSRIIDKKIYDDLGIEDLVYRYVGPLDKRTRPFCKSHIDGKYTESEIEKFPIQNGSGINPYFSPGGMNCRHRLIPII